MTENIIKNEIIIKVVLLGESGVGKSSIILRYVENEFYSNYISTILSTFTPKKVYFEKFKKELIFNIWDTAGQEKFRSIVSLNYKDAAVIILVFDINNQNSFKCIKDYWYPQVRDKAPKNAILALVGAKCDEIKEDTFDEFEAQNYAKSINAIYKTTSSLQNIGINELFDEIGNKILSSDMHDFIFARNNTNLTFGKTSGEDEDSNYKFSRAASSEKANDNKLRKNKSRCC